MSCAEPNFATIGILAVNDGSEGKIAVAAEMPVNLTIAEGNTIAIRTSSSVFSPTNTEKHAVVNVVGAIWGRNPVIIGNDVAVQNINSSITPALYARNLIREEMRSGSSTDAGEANLPWGKSSVVKAVIVRGTIIV
ncbi:MAG: hypothetical protein ABIH38_03460 [Patescibacteria group bacterium]